MNELITVIVPIYRVEAYLRKCIDSILGQTYDNLEIILIDDGSPDGCPAICDEYANMDKRVRVIHKKNGGLSIARNTGIELAKGEYIAFVDADDYINERLYEILHKNLIDTNSDISVCDFVRVYEESEVEEISIKEKISLFNNMQAMDNLYNNLDLQTIVAWNKLYKKYIFKYLRYPVGMVHEDEYVIHLILDNVDNIVYTNLPLYYYVQRTDSIMGRKYNIKRLDGLEAVRLRMEYFFEKGYSKLFLKAYCFYMNAIMYNYIMLKKYYPEEKKIREKLMKIFLTQLQKNNSMLSMKIKVKYRLFLFKNFEFQLKF